MPRPQRKLGLALGSGAARGMAHIGVLKVLDEEDIRVDAIAGTSFGAFIGALYAAGVPVRRMEEVACNVDWRQLARLLDPTFPTSGLIDGKNVARFMAELLPARTFEELAIPMAVVTTDVETGEMLIIRKGELLPALQASIAFPGIFTPVRFGDRFLVDGGLRNPVPVDVAREMGTEAVIGVCAIPEVRNISAETFLPSAAGEQESTADQRREGFTVARVERLLRELWPGNSFNEHIDETDSGRGRRPPGIFRICAQSVAIMENEINALRLQRDAIDLLIRPDLNGITLLEFHRATEAIRAGEVATRRLAEQIQALVAGRCNPGELC